MRGERFCVIINRIVSTCTGNLLRMIKKHLFDVQVEQIRNANLESRAAHTHPKNTQVPPPPGLGHTKKGQLFRRKQPLSPPIGMFRQEGNLRLSDKNSILLT